MREGTFRFQKSQIISWLVEKPVSFSRITLFHENILVSCSIYFIAKFNCEAWRDSHFTNCYILSHFNIFFPISFQYFFFHIGIRKWSFVPVICFHLAAPLGNGRPLMQLDNSFIWMEPLAHQAPRFATHSCNIQHWFSKRRSPVCSKWRTAILFLLSSYTLQRKRIKCIWYLTNIFVRNNGTTLCSFISS
jgi:hypothetical protein